MADETKIARARELITKRDEIDAELDGLFNGEATKRKWTRKTPQEPATPSESQ